VKFDSDAERRLAVLLEGDDNVVRWMKPGPGQFRIEDADGTPYNPDFVVETKAAKIIIEPKRDEELTDAGVLAKARAASVWCWIATEHHAKKSDGKPWTYALVPDTAINASATLGGLVATYTRQVDMAERMNVQIKGISGETATL
jgi:type III restriction enzyme